MSVHLSNQTSIQLVGQKKKKTFASDFPQLCGSETSLNSATDSDLKKVCGMEMTLSRWALKLHPANQSSQEMRYSAEGRDDSDHN